MGVPSAPINSCSQVLADPQVEHNGWVELLALPNEFRTRTFGTPVPIDGRREPVRRPPRPLGADTADVLAERAVRSSGKAAGR